MNLTVLVCKCCNKEFTVETKLTKKKSPRLYCSVFCKTQYGRNERNKRINIPEIIDLYQNQEKSLEFIKKIYKVRRSYILNLLKNHSIKIRDRWVIASKHNLGKPCTEERKEKIRQKTLAYLKSGKMPRRETSIELILKLFLKELNINFEEQKVIGNWCYDFYFPNFNILIEADGDYWHGNPKFYKDKLNSIQIEVIERDIRKTNSTEKQGFKLLRFWENDIKNNLENVKNIILNSINNSSLQQLTCNK